MFLRKKLLIMPRFQLTLIAVNCSIITLVFGVLALRLSQTFAEMAPLIGLSGASAELSGRLLSYQASQIESLLILSYCIAMFSSGFITLVLSYRFAGPLVRLRSYFESVGRPGQPVYDLRFRSGDFFTDLPPTINTALQRIRGAAAAQKPESQQGKEGEEGEEPKSHLRVAR